MKLFRRHRGSQTEAPTPVSHRAGSERPALPNWSVTVHCSCGGGMSPTAIVTANTVRMTRGKCGHSVDVTFDIGEAGE